MSCHRSDFTKYGFFMTYISIFSENVDCRKSGLWHFEIFTDLCKILGKKKPINFKDFRGEKLQHFWSKTYFFWQLRAEQYNIWLNSANLRYFWVTVKKLGLLGIFLSCFKPFSNLVVKYSFHEISEIMLLQNWKIANLQRFTFFLRIECLGWFFFGWTGFFL